MIGIIMAGGKGSRMNLPEEKLLLKYKKPIILHVVDALVNSKCFSKVLAITSNNSPKTRNLLEENNVQLFNTPGNGYVEDLNLVLKSLNDSVLITSADLPFLDEDVIQNVVSHYNSQNTWTTILVTKEFLEQFHLSSDYEVTFADQKCYYTGISLVNTRNISTLANMPEKFIIINDKRIAFNLNTKNDYDLFRTT